RLLQQGGRRAGREAVGGSGQQQAQAARLGDRTEAGGGRRTSGDLLSCIGCVLATLLQGAHDDGQRQLQWLAARRRLVRPLTTVIANAAKQSHEFAAPLLAMTRD